MVLEGCRKEYSTVTYRHIPLCTVAYPQLPLLEVVIEGCRDEYPTDNAEWREFEFVVKPGDPTRRPSWLSPYHL